MLNIKEMALTVALEDGIVLLKLDGKIVTHNKEQYLFSFSQEERKISASVSLDLEENITVGTVAVKIENLPFRESFNLRGQSPIQLTMCFDENPTRLCAQYQQRDWWSRPAFINSFAEVPERTQSLFLEGENKIGYILPMVGDKTKTYITKGTDTSICFEMTAYTEGINQIDDLCFVLSEGENLYDVSERVFQKACQLKKIPMKASRNYPEMFEYFGWCSWDAFYTDISEGKVLEKVEELKSKKIPARWILMDDGWLATEDQCLTTFEPDSTKFPNEFKDMIKKIKKESDINWIGVWHTLGGYWGGVAPDSKLALEMKDNLYKTKNGKLIPHYEPEKGFGFWRKWYTYLKNQGIDFVKVDGQSALKNHYKNNEEIAKVALGTHMSLEAAVMMFMNGNIINCMGMALENVFSRSNTCISRNSDDFVPDEEKGFREHMLQNAYNALYHDNVYVCDWDMYWTNHADAKKHALVRAISGGPIYISDRIGETIYEEIMPLVYHDGRILRMDRCAKPTMDCIFDSPLKDRALKLTNTVNGTGVIAAFHISESNELVEADLSPSEIYDLSGEIFGAYRYFDKSFMIMKKQESIHVKLTEKDYELILFLPMKEHVTPIGLVNKYMSNHAVKTIYSTEKQTVITLIEGGIFAFYKEVPPTKLMVNGTDMTKEVKTEHGYYSINIADYMDEVVITIE